MKDSKRENLEKIKGILIEKNIIFDELANGHLKVDGINLWGTTGKWYDPSNDIKGNGVNGFLTYLHSQGLIK